MTSPAFISHQFESPFAVVADDLELWRGERCLFEHLSFTLNRSVLHLHGANGSGKTTLLKVLCGLTSVERGQVTWRLKDQKLSPDQMRGRLAYSGHQDALNPSLTVAENLLWSAGLHQTVALADIEALLEHHRLSSLVHLRAGSLSAGQKRRIALLRSVLSNVPVWVWDEPYANMDKEGVEWVDRLMHSHINRGGNVLISAHQRPKLPEDSVQMLELKS